MSDQNLNNGEQSSAAAAPSKQHGDYNCQICKFKTDASEEEHVPCWWRPWGPFGGDHSKTQKWLASKIESKPVHIIVVTLVLLDLLIILTDLSLQSFYPMEEEAPDAVHTAEKALAWTSVTILSIFTLEQFVKLAVFGPRYFLKVWHAIDAFVIITSLILEILLRGPSREVASLLIIFRLWRLVRIMHALAEEITIEHEESSKHHHKLEEKMQQRIHELERQLHLPPSPPMTLHSNERKNNLNTNGSSGTSISSDVSNGNNTSHSHDPLDIL